ncbi:hypothetical protein HF086_009071 [Spodoptera exigua]|uniref:Peptidase aspartic putative domain-containing protein n=1 Tax=Spodoptera exigua TaxID=7107 RepID=A0A922MLZ5_SPOEX|nr:hypothetical protein HF086_009071 [Spodoptera exigua]
MEGLHTNQDELYTAIQKLAINIKKDSADRKTSDYFKRRLDTLNQYWSDYQYNHDRLLSEESRTHPYFIGRTYEKAKELYISTKALINQQHQGLLMKIKEAQQEGSTQEEQEVISRQSPPVEVCSRGSSSKLDELLKKQASNFRALQRTVAGINLDVMSEKWELKDALRILQARWSIIDSLHWELDSELEGTNQEYEVFLNMTPSSKRQAITRLNLCKNCLYSHGDKECMSEKRCRECNGKHNTLLHQAFNNKSSCNTITENQAPAVLATQNQVSQENHVSQQGNNVIETLLATAMIKVQASDGSYHKMRALIDQGSQASLITARATQQLALSRKYCKAVICGIGEKESNSKGVTNITCCSHFNDFTFKTDVVIMDTLISQLPRCTFNKPTWAHLAGIQLADPEYNVSRPIDILLGADVYSHIILEGIIRADLSLPVAQQTQLGWILCGNFNPFHCNVVLNQVDELQRFWENEDISESSNLSAEDLQCIEFYKNTTTRHENGMYEDQKFQKIIWRDTRDMRHQVYQLCTVTYGTKAAPFLAMMTLKQLAEDERHNYDSVAIKALEQSFYMDDVLHGSHSVELAAKLKQDLITLLKSGGFNLRKWSSNVSALQDDTIGASRKQENFDFKELETSKTLGLRWNSKGDLFTFQSKIEPSNKTPTKRSMLSDISKLFDPLGWLSPISTKLKLLFQQVWLSSSQWDDKLPDPIGKEWLNIKGDMHKINQFKLERWLGTAENNTIELHGFCDSSNKAYACVVYSKTENNEVTKISLVAGKARLAPVNKSISVPRLELCGALLLAKLLSKIQQCLISHNIKIYTWTDSKVVLAWLQGEPGRWKPFVANRVRQISNMLPTARWRYVKSGENPADCASRGLGIDQLKNHSLWWEGPSWLQSYDPDHETEQAVFTTDEETRINKKNLFNHISQQESDNILGEILVKYSSLSKLTRVLAWILRFIKQARNKKSRVQTYLTLHELKMQSIK